MLALMQPVSPRAPQIHQGTADLYPPSLPTPETRADDLQELHRLRLAQGTEPEELLGMAFARSVGSTPGVQTLVEYLVFRRWTGASTSGLPADLRPPPSFIVRAQSWEENPKLDDELIFKARARAWRAQLGEAQPALVSRSTRYGDLQTLSPAPDGAAPDLLLEGDALRADASETRDIFDRRGELVGRAFILRRSAAKTDQHWVLFDAGLPFDDLRVTVSESGYPTLLAFLSDMKARREARGVPFAHTVEIVSHFTDFPW